MMVFKALKKINILIILLVGLWACEAYAAAVPVQVNMRDIARGITVEAGTPITATINYAINPTSVNCGGDVRTCRSQIVMGIGSVTSLCARDSLVSEMPSGALTFNLIAPTVPGTYDIWVGHRSGANLGSCGGITFAGLTDTDKKIIGPNKLIVTAPPPPVIPHFISWGWGYIDNVSINNAAAVTSRADITVAPGAEVSLKFPYYGMPSISGCPYCIWQVVTGITGGTKSCFDARVGEKSGTIATTVTAPTTPGTYKLWAVGMWNYGCGPVPEHSDAGALASAGEGSSGGIMAMVTVQAPSPPTPKGSYACSCNNCAYTQGTQFRCSCQSMAGNYITTTVDAKDYNYALSNQNGYLSVDDGNHCGGYIY